jgi:hypothetical protein
MRRRRVVEMNVKKMGREFDPCSALRAAATGDPESSSSSNSTPSETASSVSTGSSRSGSQSTTITDSPSSYRLTSGSACDSLDTLSNEEARRDQFRQTLEAGQHPSSYSTATP